MIRKRALIGTVATGLFLSSSIIDLHAQSTGRYELLNQDQIVRELTKTPNIVVAPSVAPSSSSPTPNATITNIIVVKPEPIDVVLSRYEILLRVPSITLSRLTFKSGSSQLTDESARSLGKLSGAIRKILIGSPNEIFLIEGHTDFPGSQEENERLSTARAKAVYDYLIYVGGTAGENLLFHGFGNSRLAVKTNKSATANRRVEIRRITSLVALNSQPASPRRAVDIRQTVPDCGKISGQSTATLVMVNFDGRQEAVRVRNIWQKLDAVSNNELVEANAALLRYQVQLSKSGCRLVEELEDALSHSRTAAERTISVSLRGNVIRIERQ